MRIDKDGNVGIGTTSPDANLQIATGNNPAAAALTSGSSLAISSNDGNIDLLSYDDNTSVANNIAFKRFVNATDGALIHTFGITHWVNTGTTASPWNTGDRLAFNYGTSANPWSNTEVVTIEAGGNVGIGDTTPSYKLDVNGTLRATGTITGSGDITARWHTIGVTDGLMLGEAEPDGTFGVLYESDYTVTFGSRLDISTDVANGTWSTFLVANYGDNSGLSHTYPSVEVMWTLHAGTSSGNSTPSFMRSGRIRALSDASGNISYHTYGELYIGGAQTSANLNKILVRAVNAVNYLGSGDDYMLFQWQNNTGSTIESDATEMRMNGNAHLMVAIEA